MSRGVGHRRFYKNLKDEEPHRSLQQGDPDDADATSATAGIGVSRSGRSSVSAPQAEAVARLHLDLTAARRSSNQWSRMTSPTAGQNQPHIVPGEEAVENAYSAAVIAAAQASRAGSAALDPKDLFFPPVANFRFSLDTLRAERDAGAGPPPVSGSRLPHLTHADRNLPAVGDPRRHVYLLMEDPSSSRQAFFVSTFVSIMISVSAVLTAVETMPAFRNSSTPQIWFLLETTIVVIFALEYFLRAYAHSQTFRHFFRFSSSFLGIIDALCVFPYFFELAFNKGETTYEFRFTILRLFRLFRVFRAFKYSSLIQMSIEVMIVALKMSTDALLALFFFSGIVIVTFSSFLYFAERGTWDEDKKSFLTQSGVPSLFDSIPSSFWFVVVTLTTTGYGDMVPETFVGKLVAFPLMLCGILLIALPSIIVGRNFTVVWEATKHYRTSQAENIHDVFPRQENAYELESIATESRDDVAHTPSRQESSRSRPKSASGLLSAADNLGIAELAGKVQSLQESHLAIMERLDGVLRRLERFGAVGGYADPPPVRLRSPVRVTPDDDG